MMPRLKEVTYAARREHILRAAVECFARQGFARTRMEDIATAADIAKGALYAYFASKDDLFLTIYEAWGCALDESIQKQIDQLAPTERASPRHRLHALIVATGRHVQGDSVTCRVLMEGRALAAYTPTIARHVHAQQEQSLAQIEELIRQGRAQGEWPPQTDCRLQAQIIQAAIHGLMAQWHLIPGNFSWDEAAYTLAFTIV